MGNVSVKVTGMTCGHCSSAVHDEVAKVSGVTAVEVELDDGTVTIQTDGSVDSDRYGTRSRTPAISWPAEKSDHTETHYGWPRF